MTHGLANAPPCLPHKDHDNFIERQNMIQRKRLLFNYTNNARFGGFPNTLAFPPSFLPIPPTHKAPKDPGMTGYLFSLVTRKAMGDVNKKIRSTFTKSIKTLEDYAHAIGGLTPVPKIITQNKDHLWKWLTDEEFARQRLQGMNPEMIEQVRPEAWEKRFGKDGSTPFNLASVAKEIDDIIASKGGDNFETERANGRIYVCDYSMFQNNELSLVANKAFNRYNVAPIAVFFVHKQTRSLIPIAIQLFPGISKEKPVFTADDSMDWLYAKIAVNSTDGQYQELVNHLFECHMIGEAFLISLNRRLGTNHPIYQLLYPHFFGTIFINEIARADLLAQDGPVQVVIGAGVPGAQILIAHHLETYNFHQSSFLNSLRRRGFDNFEKVGGASGYGESPISGYFWEEDGLELWHCIHKFVRKILDLFYETPEDLLNDFELQEWVAETESLTGGQVKGVSEQDGKVVTIEFLTHMLTNLIWTCTAKHSAGNFAQFELYGFIPNVPGALYTPPPTSRGTMDEKAILAALPPTEETLTQVAITYLLSDTGAEKTQLFNGKYPGLDENQEARAAISEFHMDLTKLSEKIEERNAGLVYPYNLLNPKYVANSITV